jgi:hypothetical protein
MKKMLKCRKKSPSTSNQTKIRDGADLKKRKGKRASIKENRGKNGAPAAKTVSIAILTKDTKISSPDMRDLLSKRLTLNQTLKSSMRRTTSFISLSLRLRSLVLKDMNLSFSYSKVRIT